MTMRQFEIWLADLNPAFGTEPGKTRPVLIIQSNLIIELSHRSTLVCPLTTNTTKGVITMRTLVLKGTAGIKQDSDILIDQIRAIDNRRFIRKIGVLPDHLVEKVKENIIHVLDLED